MEESNIQQSTSPQISVHDVVKLENQLKGGANWFFWIAGLSLVNSLVFWFDGSLNFIVGLGITQIVDGFTSAIAAELLPNVGTVIKVIGFILVLGIAGVFALFGVMGRKRHQWALITGMILYAFDGLIFLFVGDILSLGFHVFALLGVWRGLRALKKLIAVESGQINVSDYSTPVQKPVRDRKYWMRLLLLALILLIPFILFLIFFFLLSY